MKPYQHQSHYELLEIPVTAGAEEIHAAHERLQALYAPDSVALYTLAGPSEADALRARLSEAFRVLTDPASRNAYDERLRAAAAAAPHVAARPTPSPRPALKAKKGKRISGSAPAIPAPEAPPPTVAPAPQPAPAVVSGWSSASYSFTWVTPAPAVSPSWQISVPASVVNAGAAPVAVVSPDVTPPARTQVIPQDSQASTPVAHGEEAELQPTGPVGALPAPPHVISPAPAAPLLEPVTGNGATASSAPPAAPPPAPSAGPVAEKDGADALASSAVPVAPVTDAERAVPVGLAAAPVALAAEERVSGAAVPPIPPHVGPAAEGVSGPVLAREMEARTALAGHPLPASPALQDPESPATSGRLAAHVVGDAAQALTQPVSAPSPQRAPRPAPATAELPLFSQPAPPARPQVSRGPLPVSAPEHVRAIPPWPVTDETLIGDDPDADPITDVNAVPEDAGLGAEEIEPEEIDPEELLELEPEPPVDAAGDAVQPVQETLSFDPSGAQPTPPPLPRRVERTVTPVQFQLPREPAPAAAASVPAPSAPKTERPAEPFFEPSPPAPVPVVPPAPPPEAGAIILAPARKPEVQRPRVVDIPPDAVFNGEFLRKIRQAREMSLEEISSRTRIARKTLENVEMDRYGELPAHVYLRGTLMSFATSLGLDPIRVSRGYLELMQAAKPPRR